VSIRKLPGRSKRDLSKLHFTVKFFTGWVTNCIPAQHLSLFSHLFQLLNLTELRNHLTTLQFFYKQKIVLERQLHLME
jgi:hypothetical protein